MSIKAKMSIDELIYCLDKKLEQGHWDIWREYLKEILTSQFKEYESTASEISKRLREKFEKWGHLRFLDWAGIRERNTASKEGIREIIDDILPGLYFNTNGLEKSIDSLKDKIKFDSLPNRERESKKEIFKNHSNLTRSAVYNSLKNPLENYYPLLTNYLISLEELNQKAEEIRSHLKKREWFSYWFSGRQERKMWTEGLSRLLKDLENIYPKLIDTYSNTNQKVRDHRGNFRTELNNFQEVPELKEIYEGLIARDPNPEITIDRQQDEGECAVYKITMQAVNKRYTMDNPRLKLVGQYKNANSKEPTKIDLDLTRDEKPHFCTFELTDKNKRRVELKLKIAKALQYPSLKLIGIYELPYIREDKQKEATLTKVELI